MNKEEEQASNLIKEVTVKEWNDLQNTLHLLQVQISTVSGSIQNTITKEEK